MCRFCVSIAVLGLTTIEFGHGSRRTVEIAPCATTLGRDLHRRLQPIWGCTRAHGLQQGEPEGSNLVSVNPMDSILRGAFVTARQAADLMANLGVNVDPV
jgi:hypothetical protein